MKRYLILGINIVVVLTLVVASTRWANQWRSEGIRYKVKRLADGKIERNKTVVTAKRQAGVILTGYVSEGEKEKEVKLTDAVAKGKVIEAKGETRRVISNQDAAASQVETLKAIDAWQNPAPVAVKPNYYQEPSVFTDILEEMEKKEAAKSSKSKGKK